MQRIINIFNPFAAALMQRIINIFKTLATTVLHL